MLKIATTFSRHKLTRETHTQFASDLPAPWSELGAITVSGYEIRHGESRATASVREALPQALGYVSGAVLGVYLHGLLEQPTIVAALFGAAPATPLNATFDELADVVDVALDRDLLDQLARLG